MCIRDRISIGAQSFNQNELSAIGRIHTAKDVENAVKTAHLCGIDNVNIDIMYAIPHQTRESLAETLKRAVSLDISHISLYGLAVEDGTPLASDVENGVFVPFSDDEYAHQYEYICDFPVSYTHLEFFAGGTSSSGTAVTFSLSKRITS